MITIKKLLNDYDTGYAVIKTRYLLTCDIMLLV